MQSDQLIKYYNAFIGTLIVVVGYFLVQTLSRVNTKLEDHDDRIIELEKVQVKEEMTDTFILQKLEDIKSQLKE